VQQLVVDVGNTETVVGLVSGTTDLVAHWRVSSNVPRTADEMRALIRAFLAGDGVDEQKIRRGVVGSVVPSVNQVWMKTLSRIVNGEVYAVGPPRISRSRSTSRSRSAWARTAS
jgi:type III pantothenate kinase